MTELELPTVRLATLRRLQDMHPGYSRLFQERGHCHAAAGHAQAVKISAAAGKTAR